VPGVLDAVKASVAQDVSLMLDKIKYVADKVSEWQRLDDEGGTDPTGRPVC
jgi:hypothetical protein